MSAIDVDLFRQGERSTRSAPWSTPRARRRRGRSRAVRWPSGSRDTPKGRGRRRRSPVRQAVDAGRGHLGEARGLPVPVSVGLQPPARPRRARARRLRPFARPAGRSTTARPISSAPRPTADPGGPRRPPRGRHPVARPLPRRLPRARGEPPEPGARPPIARRAGIRARGFAAPARAVERGARPRSSKTSATPYSSDFQLGYDDLPFFPWRGDRFSTVLQVPVHPICEGAVLRGRGRRPDGRRPPRRGRPGQGRGGRAGVRLWPPRAAAGPIPGDRPALAEAVDRRVAALADHADRVRPLVALAARASMVGRPRGRGPLRGPVRGVGPAIRSRLEVGPGPARRGDPPGRPAGRSSSSRAWPTSIARPRRDLLAPHLGRPSGSRRRSARPSTGRRSRRSRSCPLGASPRGSSANCGGGRGGEAGRSE